MNKATFTCKTALAFAVGAAVFLPSFADRNITEDVKLTKDTDWTSDGTVNLSDGVVVDLNGHDLRVAGLSGTGRFISSEDELIDNGSFEEIEGGYPTGWSLANVEGAASLGVCNSNDPTWSKGLDAQNGGRSIWWWCNSSGASARGGATLTKNVVVDKKGIYHLSFYVAARPLFEDITNDKYKNMRVYVDIDGNTIGYAVCTDAAWEEATFDVLLDAGNRSITFRSDATYGNREACGLLDNVSLRRKSSLRLGASAAGVYSCQNVSVDGNITVLAESQTLNGDCNWSGLGNVNIAAGATIDLAGQNLSMNGLTYDTAARLCDTELIKNGSFETDTESWTLQNASGGKASVFRNSTWCGNSKDGSWHMAFWSDENTYDEATVSQEVDIPVSGTYRLSCWTKKRDGNYAPSAFKIIADGIVYRTVTCQNSWQQSVVDVDLQAGKRVIAFTSSLYWQYGPCGGIDLVSLRFPSDAAITNSNNEAVSELHVNIASGSVSNDKIALGGNLKLVKEGAGTFVSQKAQTYTGGTIVAAGTAQPPDPATQEAWDTSASNFKAFGTGSITVAQGAVFDVRANYDYGGIILDGGTLANGKWAMTQTSWGGVGIGALTKDSSINMQYTMVFGNGSGTLGLGAHRLSVNLENGQVFKLRYPNVSDGTFAVSGRGWLGLNVACDINARFEVDCPMAVVSDIRVRDYIVNLGNNADSSSGGKELKVYGTFRPNTDKFYGCTMLDKSTIDLSGRTTALPAKSALTAASANEPIPLSVSFEAGATVTVRVDGRTGLSELARTKVNDAYAGYLMKWETKPDTSVKFVLDGDAAKKYRLVCTDEGLVLRPPFGFMILMR